MPNLSGHLCAHFRVPSAKPLNIFKCGCRTSHICDLEFRPIVLAGVAYSAVRVVSTGVDEKQGGMEARTHEGMLELHM